MLLRQLTLRTLYCSIFIFTMAACHSLRPVSTDSKSDSSTRKSTTKSSRLRQDVTKYALQQEGAKYKYGAKGPKRFDCSGFTSYVYKSIDISLPNGSYNQARVGKKIASSKAAPGDLIFFGKGGKVNHVALVVRNSSKGIEVIHSTSSRGVIRENVSISSYWKSRILYVRTVIGS